MARTLLQVVQRACRRLALPVPSSVISNSDAGVKQMQVLLEDMITEAMNRWNWEGLMNRATFTSVAAESQGPVADLLGADSTRYFRMVNDTLWDLTNDRQIVGPVNPQQWQVRKAADIGGSIYVYRIQSSELIIHPAPSAGLSFSFFWLANTFAVAADGTTFKSEFTVDSDTTIFDDDFLHYGLLYMWKMEKGLPYAEDLRTWELMAMNKAQASGTKPVLHLDSPESAARPGILVPYGSWPL